MDRLQRDIRFVLRGFRRTPAFVVTALAILGLGIGMSVAMFTVFRTVLVRRLPVINQDRIVVMWTYRFDPTVELTLGTKWLATVRRESRTMRDIAGVAHWPPTAAPFLDGERSVGLNRGMVTGNFFDVVGARPALGRLLRPSDDETAQSSPADSTTTHAMVISYGAWQEKFGGDSSVIGRRLVEPLLHMHYEIVGVAPPGFDYPIGAEYWIPMWQGWSSDISAFAVARLAPGATVTSARDEYVSIETRASPAMHFGGAHAATFTDTVLGNAKPVLALLTAAVGLLLIIACLNVGNLLLLRASSRTREIAIRRALGAAYGDIVRQLLVEAASLAAAGGALGLLLSLALLRALAVIAPAGLPRLDDLQLSGAPVIAAIIVSSLAVLLFGVGPALFSARSNLASPLRLDSRSGNETRRRRGVRQTLVASQVALAMIMLGGAALLARSLEHLERQDTGYVSDHLSVFYYTWNARRYDSAYKMVDLAARVATRLETIPGVVAATPLVVPPMMGNSVWQVRFDFDGQTDAEAAGNPAVPVEIPGPRFFKTFGISVVRGRAFDDNDRATSPLVAMVSQSAARKLWPGQDPIGKKIRMHGATDDGIVGGNGWRTVVGVAHDANLRTIREAAAMVYLPSRQGYWQGSFAIRSTVDLAALIPALKAAGHDVDPDLGLWHPQTMDQILAGPLSQPRLGALLMSSFGLVALLLAAIGLYGVMASLVRDQMR
ncbi:MAG TPA: ABC transporter permease, partial [Gemmatimonadaceae bacterium]|nr:ABC transporter permease [Gemmatimonadaceae bacterium]